VSQATQLFSGYAVPHLRLSGGVGWIRWLTLVAIFGLWQALSVYNQAHRLFNPVFLPSPTMVLQAAADLSRTGELQRHILASALRVLAGFSIGTVVAVTLGVLVTRSKVFENILEPILNLIGPIPPFAFLPMFIIWLGIGENSKTTLIVYATSLPILAYTIDGMRNVNPLLIRSALSLGASEFDVFRRVILKAALPNILVGMRISLALSFSALVVAESVGADAGLGYLIVDSRNYFKMPNMLLAAALIGIEYTIFERLLRLVERRLFRWRRGGLEHALER
jgi:ABC-type nitrate/sulfonate/bicarbonate transport system permease component